MNKIKIALAGYGAGGRIYNAPIIDSVAGMQIAKILTSRPENIKAAKEDFPEAKVVQDYENILNDPSIELVVLPLPNHLHEKFAAKALEANKHVVLEKPITPSLAAADRLIRLAKEKNRILSVNHNRRWDSDIQTIKKVLKTNVLGALVEYEAHFDRFRPGIKDSWKEKQTNPGNGILYDLGSHLIDQALMLFGFPTKLFADLRVQREHSEVIDNFELILYYPNNLKVTLKAGMLVGAPVARYQLFGTKGSFIKSGMDVQEEKLKLGISPKEDPEWGKEPQEIWGSIYTAEGEHKLESEVGDYRKFYQNIYGAIRHNEPLEVSPEDARDVIRIIELAHKSNQEGRTLQIV